MAEWETASARRDGNASPLDGERISRSHKGRRKKRWQLSQLGKAVGRAVGRARGRLVTAPMVMGKAP